MNGSLPLPSHRFSRASILLPAVLVLVWCLLQLVRDPGFFWYDDVQAQSSPFFEEIVRSWHQGEWPILSRNSWSTGNLAGEFQFGTFSPSLNALLLAVWCFPLSLAAKAAVVSICHLMWLATGVFVLGRHRGLSVALATMAALATALSGWNIAWGATDWLPFLIGFSWVPWVWWSLETAIASDSVWRRWLRPALFTALLITTGGTFAIAMLPMIGTWLAARALISQRNWKALGPLLVAGALGIGLSAPAWWLLHDYAATSTRWNWGWGMQYGWMVPWQSWPGLVLPSFVAPWRDFFGLRESVGVPHVSLELACGLVPVAALASAFLFQPKGLLRKLRWELVFLVFCVLLVSLPSVGQFRWSFRWLPLFHLVLALTAASALQQGLAARAAACGVGLTAAAWAGATLLTANRSPVLAGWLLGLSVAWWLGERLTRRGWVAWLPVAVVASSLGLTYWYLPTHQSVPKYPFDDGILDPAPLDRTRLYLSLYSSNEIAHASDRPLGSGSIVRPVNSMDYADLRFLNGYSSFDGREVKGLFEPHGELIPEKAESLAGPDGERLLLFLGVDGLIFSSDYLRFADKLGPEWKKIAEGPEGVAYHREPRRFTPVKVLTFVFDRPGVPLVKPTLQIIAERRNSVTVQVTPAIEPPADVNANADPGATGTKPAIAPIAFVRPYLDGYQAFLNGQPVPIRVYRNILPIVELPASASGLLELRYRPRGLTSGLMITGITAVIVLLIALVGVWQRARARSGTRAS